MHDLTVIRPDRETAFQVYWSMPERSLRKLAEQPGIPEGTVFEWSRSGHWAEQLAEEERQATLSVRRHASDLLTT